MSKVQSGNITHDQTVTISEGARQVAVAAAGSVQATARTADIAHYRASLASAKLNSCGVAQFIYALQELGAGSS